MPKFRKKPVVIEAMQMILPLSQEFQSFIGLLESGRSVSIDFDANEIQIETLEGTMIARPGDWIIRGVKGELYPCKPDIFEQTYEPAND
jgi:hypothetical protein